MPIQKRGLLTGLAAALAAPAIVRTPGLLMQVRSRLLAVDALPSDEPVRLSRAGTVELSPYPTNGLRIGTTICINGENFKIVGPDTVSTSSLTAALQLARDSNWTSDKKTLLFWPTYNQMSWTPDAYGTAGT